MLAAAAKLGLEVDPSPLSSSLSSLPALTLDGNNRIVFEVLTIFMAKVVSLVQNTKSSSFSPLIEALPHAQTVASGRGY